MSLAGDSILITPGSGATVATELVGGKEHQVVMQADPRGHIFGSLPMFAAMLPLQVHLAAANALHWDLFNAAALLVRVRSIIQVPAITIPVAGIVFDWKLERTTAVGTGGAVITPWLADLSQAALDAGITCRSKPTGGATAGVALRNYALNSEELNAATLQIASLAGVELIPQSLLPRDGGPGLVLRQNQGLRCVQVTNSAEGNTGWLISFTVE